MRVLFLMLLIANLVLFVIGRWSSSEPSLQTREELNPDKLRILAPEK
jgi:hypothetical protein